MTQYRVFVEKLSEFQVEAKSLLNELNENLSLSLRTLRLLNVYDLFGFSPELLEKCCKSVFGETVTDAVSYISAPEAQAEAKDGSQATPELIPAALRGKKYIAVENIPGQFDQRASSAEDCVHLLEPAAEIKIRSSRLLVFDDDTTPATIEAVKRYYINAVEARSKDLSVLLPDEKAEVKALKDYSGFTSLSPSDYSAFCAKEGLAMNADDLATIVEYFKEERRDPSETELRILDTYWSDHCRHTTFTTELSEIEIEESFLKSELTESLSQLHAIRAELHREGKKLCLMELATIGARYLKSKGLLEDLEQSEENNACSIFIDASVDGKSEKWLLQFKNETHNHPTEIEPFGGASTCLGGAIRDPLSGRAYVYQAMRVTGAGDITASVSDTLPGKLPQRVISRKAAAGYSSYGNQIGLATTHVREIFHPGYTAKRLEVGAVVGAVKAENVRRESPEAGDIILMLGGRTGRDGIGGATGSSKEHKESSINECGSEVQKGNAPEERKLQRLFRRPEVTRLIKKSNDFGAGGVSVAIGELADGLDIYLDRVPTKYSGLNPTELAISESQERMAVVIEASERAQFEQYCKSENIEVTHVADVTDTARMRMFYHGSKVADLSRAFIDSAGATRSTKVRIAAVSEANPFHRDPAAEAQAAQPEMSGKAQTKQASEPKAGIKDQMLALMRDPNVASQKGLVEMFDSTIGRSTVLMPYGGATQSTPTQVSVQKLPTSGYTDCASLMSFGYNPFISSWSPYHGAEYAIVEACAKAVAAGADWSTMRFSYQEYFERMRSDDPTTWGKPTAALLGAIRMQVELGLPSIGGKDSMSGSFEHINVPPTLIAFGITTVDAKSVISPELKWEGNHLYLIKHTPKANYTPDTEQLKANWDFIRSQIASGNIVSAWALGFGGVGEAVAQMSFGNQFGVDISYPESQLFDYDYGSILVESEQPLDFPAAVQLGRVTEDYIRINGTRISIDALQDANEERYAKVYPASCPPAAGEKLPVFREAKSENKARKHEICPEPLVFIPVFPGTNCDYDTAKAFRKAGAKVQMMVFRNLSAADVLSSIDEMKSHIDSCQILALAGGFSAGDEPDGSGKFIANVLNNATIAASIEALLERGGLILGICNGFQALVKSGLLPYGKLGCVTPESPTLFRNDINRHISQMATTRVVSTASPWLAGMTPGELHTIAVSHGEGKFTVSRQLAKQLFESGQVAFQYADPIEEQATMTSPLNPNGSICAIEGIISPDGQILGKMGHSERYEANLFKNISEEMNQPIFDNAVRYFQK